VALAALGEVVGEAGPARGAELGDEIVTAQYHGAAHTSGDAIVQAERQLGTEVEFMRYAKEIAYGHQEKWDGSGYPVGDSGDDIPIPARLMAVADVYDALISRRVYKDGMPHEKAVGIIQEGSGSHFDPDMVEAFLAIQEEFRSIAARYADSDIDFEQKKVYMQAAGA
jgi:putative two-component system response regulator